MSQRPILLLALVALMVAAPRLAAQRQTAQAPAGVLDELQILDEEQKVEAAGDVARAQAMLEGVLDRNPASLSALISLERLLRTQGRVAEVIPRVSALLKFDATSPIGYQMLIRAYSALDSLPALARAADAWIRATPRLETPYREIAAVYRGRKDEQSALMVLQRGRARIGRPDALAFELGDLYATMSDAPNAAQEWARAIGRDADGFNLVQHHLAALPDGGARILPTLVDLLTAAPTTPNRLRAAATFAMDAGLGPRAQAIVTQVAAGLKGPELQNFLVEVARRADGAQLPSLAYWAYTRLLAAGGPQERLLAVRSRLAELALATGDTAAARSNFAILEKASVAGSPERRQALALRIEMTARSGDAVAAGTSLAAFRQEFPDAGELDRLAATVGNAYLARGDEEGASRALAGVRGPRTSFAQGRLYLQRGNIADARNALLAAAGGLQGSDATEAIALVSLLGRLSTDGGQLVGQAEGLAQEGKRKAAIDLLQGGTAALTENERAAILDYAADLADHGDMAAEAEALRRQLVSTYPRALETPAALLTLGRSLAARPATSVEARQLLEKLIVDYPGSALVPEARRQLELLQTAAPAASRPVEPARSPAPTS